MKAMVFSAGLGTRFKPWTDKHPKALAVVNDKTLLQRNIEYLQRNGITNVIVNVHHFPDQIIDAVDNSKGWGSQVLISDESSQVLETGGGLLKAKGLFNSGERFVTCNVDVLTELDISKLLAFHEEKKALISFGVTDRKTSRYLLFNPDGRLVGWRNTATGEEKGPVTHDGFDKVGIVEKAYSCVVIFEPTIFDLIPFTGKFSLIDVYLALADSHPIFGYDHSGDKFVDVGKPESLTIAETIFV